MTAVLMCDGCGRIASSGDPEDADPTRSWWCLYEGPVPGGGQGLTLPIFTQDAEPDGEDEPDDEPERHFCSRGCLRAWVDAQSAKPDEGP